MKQPKSSVRDHALSTVWLLLGAVLLFAGKQWDWPLATLASSLFILHYVRLQPVWRGFITAWLVQSVAIFLIYSGAAFGVFGGIWIYAGAMLGATAIIMVPFMIDRLLAPSLPLLAGTLVFPFARTALEYLASYNSPYGEWAALATDFAGWLPLAQLAALTGIWGITFLVAWFASIGNAIWLDRNRPAWSVAGGYVLIVLAVFAYGYTRISQAPERAPTVKVAGIVLPDSAHLHLPGGASLYQDYQAGNINEAGLSALSRVTRHGQEYLFGQSEIAARGGAKIIFWAETNALVLKQDEAAFIARGRQLARQYGVYLGMAPLVINPRQDHPEEDKIILVTPSGTIAWQYYKAHPLAGEKAVFVAGSTRVPVLDTPYGRLAAMICYDSDFIRFARQAGQDKADLLAVPSNDWRDIAEMRARITRYRAIENGVTLLRPTSHGISEIVAPDGRLLASRNYFTDPSSITLASVPTHGHRTVYARVGDFLPWFCLGGLVLLFAASMKIRVSKGTKPWPGEAN